MLCIYSGLTAVHLLREPFADGDDLNLRAQGKRSQTVRQRRLGSTVGWVKTG